MGRHRIGISLGGLISRQSTGSLWERFGYRQQYTYISFNSKRHFHTESNFCRSHPHSTASHFLASEPEIDCQRVSVLTALLHVKVGNFLKDVLRGRRSLMYNHLEDLCICLALITAPHSFVLYKTKLSYKKESSDIAETVTVFPLCTVNQILDLDCKQSLVAVLMILLPLFIYPTHIYSVPTKCQTLFWE